MNHKPLSILTFVILCFFRPAYANDSTLVVENAWIAEAPPVSKVMVAYMTFKNTGTKPVVITAAQSDTYSSIEFHQTEHKNGIASMLHHKNLTIPAGKTLELKRGSYHLMLFNPTQALKTGDTVDIRISTEDNICQTISIPVKKTQF